MSAGKWQKEIPTRDGRYWVATQDGLSAGLATVVYHPNGKRIMAGHAPHGEWGGWWWSEPVIEPKAPPPDIWDRARAFVWAQAGYGAYIAPADDVGTWIVSEHRTPAEPAPETSPCTLPPEGWTCSRTSGHDGPCAASPTPAMQTAMAIVKIFGR